MLDGVMRRVIDPPLTAIGHHLATAGISADAMTGFSLTCGLLCAGSIAGGNFGLALLFLALGRIGDGLDGAIARATKPTDRGGFIDIVGDFVFYGAVPLAFAWFDPQENALAAAWLLFTFYVNGASFLAYAAVAGRPADGDELTRPQVHLLHGRPRRRHGNHRDVRIDDIPARILPPVCGRLRHSLPAHRRRQAAARVEGFRLIQSGPGSSLKIGADIVGMFQSDR